MKKLLEVLVCFIHPLAVVLGWINLAGRSDLSGGQKLAWGVFLIVPVVPFVYVLTGGDSGSALAGQRSGTSPEELDGRVPVLAWGWASAPPAYASNLGT